LIVIAILGTLAVVVLLALNPVQQLARTRDAGRISGITQLGHALEAFGTSHNGVYPPVAGGGICPAGSTNWLNCLVSSGEIASLPSNITNNLTGYCTTNAQNGWCYNFTAATSRFIVYSRLEGNANITRCPAVTNLAYAVYSSADSRGGIICLAAGEPTVPGTATGYGVCTAATCINQFLP